MLNDMVLQLVSTRIHDDTAVNTLHYDTAVLLWQVTLHFECFAQK